MTEDDFTDKEVIKAMLSFAERGFMEAANKWFSGQYSQPGDDAGPAVGYRRWLKMRVRMRELVNELKSRA